MSHNEHVSVTSVIFLLNFTVTKAISVWQLGACFGIPPSLSPEGFLINEEINYDENTPNVSYLLAKKIFGVRSHRASTGKQIGNMQMRNRILKSVERHFIKILS